MPHSLWDPSSPTRDWTWALGSESAESQPLDCQEVPLVLLNADQIGLPWWRSGWESAGQCRGHGFEPWSGKIPRAAEQLGPWATTTEPARLEPVLRNQREAAIVRGPRTAMKSGPHLPQLEKSPHTETKTQHSHK